MTSHENQIKRLATETLSSLKRGVPSVKMSFLQRTDINNRAGLSKRLRNPLTWLTLLWQTVIENPLVRNNVSSKDRSGFQVQRINFSEDSGFGMLYLVSWISFLAVIFCHHFLLMLISSAIILPYSFSVIALCQGPLPLPVGTLATKIAWKLGQNRQPHRYVPSVGQRSEKKSWG